MIIRERERLIKSDISSIENMVRHAFNQGYDLGYKDGLQKSETVTGFADRCRECGVTKGKISNDGYTVEELNTFLNGISLRLLSLRSAQH